MRTLVKNGKILLSEKDNFKIVSGDVIIKDQLIEKIIQGKNSENAADFDKVIDEFDRVIGLDKLLVVHVNDSKNERGARKDRHENIGKGHIGLENLVNVIYNKRLDNIPKILETPYINDVAPYKEEIELLRKYEK